MSDDDTSRIDTVGSPDNPLRLRAWNRDELWRLKFKAEELARAAAEALNATDAAEIRSVRLDVASSALAPSTAWQTSTPPRNVRCLVTVAPGTDDPARRRVKIATVSPAYGDVRWVSDGVTVYGVVAWMPAPEPYGVEQR